MEINFSGQYSRQDMLKAMQTHYLPTQAKKAMTVIPIIIFLFIFLGIFTHPALSQLDNKISLILPNLFFLTFFAMPFWMPYVNVAQTMKNPDYSSPVFGQITNESIKIVMKQANSEAKWTLHKKFIQKKEFVLIYQQNNCFNVFPRHFFHREADWQAFLNLMKNNIPGK
jgi:hypothetical protein